MRSKIWKSDLLVDALSRSLRLLIRIEGRYVLLYVKLVDHKILRSLKKVFLNISYNHVVSFDRYF